MSTTATIVVEFGDGADSDALVVVELDDESNLDDDGEEKTTFNPGDQPYFLVHHESTVRIGSVECSSGMVTGGSSVSRSRTQRMEWSDTDESQELPHIPSGEVSWTWYGNQATVTRDGRSLPAIDGVPAVGDANYSMAAYQYQLIPPSLDLSEDEEYPILIVVTMEAA